MDPSLGAWIFFHCCAKLVWFGLPRRGTTSQNNSWSSIVTYSHMHQLFHEVWMFRKFLVKTQLHINNNAILERNWPYYARRGSWCWTKCNFPKPGAVKVGHTILAYLPFIYLLLILLCSLLWLNYYHEYWSQTSRQMQIKINHYWYSFKGRHKGGLFLESCFKGDWSKHRA